MTTAARSRNLTPAQVLSLFDEQIGRMSPQLARSLRDLMEQVRSRATSEELARLVSARDLDAIENLFTIDQNSPEFTAFQVVMGRAVDRGARVSAELLGEIPTADGGDFIIDTNVPNPMLAAFAQQLTSQRISEIDNATRDMVRGIAQVELVEGNDPFAIARRLRDSIGLTQAQEGTIRAYRGELERLDPRALDRRLRDRRSDRSIRRAIDAERPLSQAQVDSLVERYQRRWIAYRSNVIGRTEAARAVNGAQHELIQSLINEGKIDARQVTREWITTPDEKLRAEHAAIPGMNPDGVQQNQPFQSPLGPIMYPGDPDAPARNTIQCRCAVFVEIADPELLGL